MMMKKKIQMSPYPINQKNINRVMKTAMILAGKLATTFYIQGSLSGETEVFEGKSSDKAKLVHYY